MIRAVKVVVAGGTGFIGRRLALALGAEGHEVVVLSRAESEPGPGVARVVAWGGPWQGELEGAGAVVDLAGAPVAARRWSKRRKAEIRSSRVDATRRLVEAIGRAKRKPEVLVNASAIGYYGDRGEERLTEGSAPGSGFLAETCVAWEAQAARAQAAGARAAWLRFGIVLSAEGGALARMLPPFNLGVGGRLGSGRQYMSWIHAEDAVGLLRLALGRREAEGPINAVAPAPATNAEFSRALAAVLGKPCLLPAPAFALRLALGEMSELLLGSQRVEPVAALALGYAFRHPELQPALRDLLAKPRSPA